MAEAFRREFEESSNTVSDFSLLLPGSPPSLILYLFPLIFFSYFCMYCSSWHTGTAHGFSFHLWTGSVLWDSEFGLDMAF